MTKTIAERLFGNEETLIPKAAATNKSLNLDMKYTLRDQFNNEQIQHKIVILSKLANILHKGNQFGVAYTAIVENNDKLFISCAGSPPRYGWNKEENEVKTVLTQAKRYLDNEISSFELYKTLAILGNGIVIQSAFNEKNRLLELSKRAEEISEKNKFKAQSELFNNIKNKAYNDLSDYHFAATPEGFEDIIQLIINKIFQNTILSDIEYALEKDIELVPFTNEYYNVHVEAKGVYHVVQTQGSSSFIIGLATINDHRLELAKPGFGENPGCCTGCAVEFNSLNKIKKFEINRNADYENKFPPGKDYKPSLLITNDEKMLNTYGQDIISVISSNELLLEELRVSYQGYEELSSELAGQNNEYI